MLKHKIFASLLIATLAAGGWAAQLRSLPGQAHELPAGCHEHGGKKMPAQAPSHNCCLIGHEVAILQTSHALRPATQCERVDLVTSASRVAAIFGHIELLPINSADPPCTAPLRI